MQIEGRRLASQSFQGGDVGDAGHAREFAEARQRH